MFCNTADNRYFYQAEKRGLRFDGLTPAELIAQRLAYVEKTPQEVLGGASPAEAVRLTPHMPMHG